MNRRQLLVPPVLLLVALGFACHSSRAPAVTPMPPVDAGVVEPPPPSNRLVLRDGWNLQSSAKVQGAGAELSQPGYAPRGWYPVTLPSTVLAALVASSVHPDPYVGDNLRQIPAEPFKVSWWYRTELRLPEDFAEQAVWLGLDGVNYRANVWFNGHPVAAADVVAGTFTAYEWNVSEWARPGAANALAIEIFPPDKEDDLAINWLDWNATPPDRNMGIWRDVYLARSGAVAVRGTRILSDVDESLERAHLTVKAELGNTTTRAIHTTVRARLESIELSQEVDLAPGETRTVSFAPASYPQLELVQPRLWWPAQLGKPELYQLRLDAEVDGESADFEIVRFGIREVSFELDENGHRVFRVNGKRILVRGGGWASDMLLRPATPERLEAELAYVLDLGFNTIRLEGKLENQAFYDRTDALGIMTMPGWMCCDLWEKWDDWQAIHHRIASASLDAQARLLRNHPSVITFLIGSDTSPPEDVELEYLAVLDKLDWPNPVMPSASEDTTPHLGKSGVKMTGPYDWIAPSYWYLDEDRGGAFGFNTETGPGPSLPELDSLRAMLTPAALEKLWTDPGARQLHAGTEGSPFDNLGLFAAALSARHGAPTSLEDFVKKAQLMNYENTRAQFEAYARNKYTSTTGVIYWLLNNSWPSLIWHVYAHDLTTAGTYFGAKKANEALHIQYSYDDQSVVVVNHAPTAYTGLSASVRVLNLDASQRFGKDVVVDVGEDASTQVLTIPTLTGLSGTYFVALRLSRNGQLVSDNFYWLSRKAEIIDWQHSDFYHTATAQFGDFTALAGLPASSINASASFEKDGARGVAHVTLENPTASIAFFVRLEVTRGRDGDPVAPVLWQDNYVTLLPGEKRTLDARYLVSDLRGWAPAIEISGWNIPPRQIGK